MSGIEVVFWSSLFVVLYTYVGYGIISAWLARNSRKKHSLDVAPFVEAFEPEVTLLVAAYNEESVIAEKVLNSNELDYPADKLNHLFVTDGSTDGTVEILNQIEGATVLHEDARRGKIGAINRAMPLVETPIVVLTDANAMLSRSSIRAIVRHYRDPQVGGVSGEKRIRTTSDSGSNTKGEGLYWRYESALKRFDSEIGSVVGAAGEVFSIRTGLFQEIEPDSILDDFMISLRVVEQGFVVKYEPNAAATEEGSADFAEEMKRKVRICAGGFQSISRLPALLNPFRFGVISWQYISHRVLRWTITPAALILLVVSGALLAPIHPLYMTACMLQLLFYTMAVAGWATRNDPAGSRLLFVPFYFVFMHAAAIAGFYRFARGSQSVLWEKAARAKMA
jgi:biofilm PGA synthesis N-glycosyltransferase PgaC